MRKFSSTVITTFLITGLFSCGGEISQTTEDGLIITREQLRAADRCLETPQSFNNTTATRAFQSFEERLGLSSNFPAATPGESHRYERTGIKCSANDLLCRYFYRTYTDTGTITNGAEGIRSPQDLHEHLQEIVQRTRARPTTTNNTNYCVLENIHYIRETDNIAYGISFDVPLFANPVVKIDKNSNEETTTGYRMMAEETREE